LEGAKTTFRPFACELSAVVMLRDVAPRIGPDGSGTLDGDVVVPAGAEAYLIDNQDGQYKVQLFDGNTGWINAEDAVVRERDSVRSEFCRLGGRETVGGVGTVDDDTPGAGGGFVAPPPTRLDVPRVIINTGFLNIRSGPGAQFTVLTTLPGGTELEVLGVAPDGVWYLVETGVGTGWLNNEFTIFRGDGRNLPVITETVVEPEIALPTAEITNAVTLYAAPDPTLGVVGALSGPIEVAVVARTEDGDWVQLETDLGFAWVQTNRIVLRGNLSLIPVITNPVG
jgi:uncharacterized protein YraI